MSDPNASHAPIDLQALRLAAIVESADDAIVSKDLDGTIRSWNPAAERIFGYTAEEMVGDTIFKLIPPELHDEEHELLRRIRLGEHVSHYETSRVRKDGRRIRIALTLSPLRAPDGHLVGASAIKRDITAQRALEAQLQQALRMEAVGRLAGGIAHDFNNLLTVIGGMTGLVLRRLPAESREHRELAQVVQAADRAASLTQQLLAFSRRQMTEQEPLVVNDVVTGMEPMLRRLLGEQIVLHSLLRQDLGQVRANRGQLEQVVMNLALNARDAMPDGGQLTIETQNVEVAGLLAQELLRLQPGPYVMLSVSDTGVGMDPVTQASIFEPFFTTKGPGHGTGLGLATVYSIVQHAGGGVYVYSEPGHGSVFKVYLPRIFAEAPHPPATPPIAPSAPAGRRTTVLLAEDEPGVRAFTRQVLEEAGYEVLPAESGEAALVIAAAHQGTIDLLLTDVVMPGINGRVLGERLRATRPDIAVLYMSGYTDDVVVRTGVVTVGAAFIQKPFSPAQLLERIRAALAPAETAGR
ncbi:MAG TPA: PAS domain S-box protein [Gemmatimonadales bacterium]|nr:PAS domain S-box protein [Gemmatimonadales bacterium]